MAGVPVFAQFTSGIGILLENTGGYITGFIFTGLIYFIYWMITEFWYVIPFVIPDLIKLGLRLTLARRLSPVLRLQ